MATNVAVSAGLVEPIRRSATSQQQHRRDVVGVVVASLTLVIAVEAMWITLVGPATNAGFVDAAAVLAFVSGAALGIERSIETLWLLMAQWKGAYWPLNTISRQVTDMVDELSTALEPFHVEIAKGTQGAEHVSSKLQQHLAEAQDELPRLKEQFDRLAAAVKQAPDNQAAQWLAAVAARDVQYISTKYEKLVPDAERATLTAGAAISGLQNFLATFKDNPGRRLLSLFLGAALGLAVAGLFGLDLIQATVGGHAHHPQLNIIVTGVIIGLGSNPTHEVIRAVQEYKKQGKGKNLHFPKLST